MKKIALVGSALGLTLFLGVGLLPSLLYGGYAGVLLAGGIVGTPLEPTFLVKALIVFGMAMGVTAVAFLFMVAGAAAASTIGALATAKTLLKAKSDL